MRSTLHTDAHKQSHNRPDGRPQRTALMDGDLALAEDVHSAGRPPGCEIDGYSDEVQVVFPYRGMLVWHVGRDEVVGDANQVLFVSDSEPFRLSEPLAGGFGELIVTPRHGVLAEIAQSAGEDLRDHPLFRRRSRRASPQLQRLRTQFLHWARDGADADPLAAEVSMVELLRSALVDEAPCGQPSAVSRRLIERTKEYLEGEIAGPLRLAQVGRAVGASPEYLTDLFRRVEGVSLHRYVVQLRLARALAVLPDTDDLAALALDVGFSSHSHFSAAFRRAFGCPPSELRHTLRSRRRPAFLLQSDATQGF